MSKSAGKSSLASSARDAIAWHVRLDASPPDESTLAGFQRWHADSPLNAAAWERLQTKLAPMRRLNGLDARTASESLRLPSTHRRKFTLGGVSLTVLAAAGSFAYREREAFSTETEFDSPVGQTKTYAFRDGSGVQLDARTKIIANNPPWSARTVSLQYGQVASWPSTAAAAPMSIVSDTASFDCGAAAISVGRFSDHLIVAALRADVVTTTPTGRYSLERGGAYRMDRGTGGIQRLPETAKQIFAWTKGQLIVIDRPISDITEGLSRYRAGGISLAARYASRRVSGVFLVSDPDVALKQLAEVIGARIHRLSGSDVVLI